MPTPMHADVTCERRIDVGGCSFCPGKLDTDGEAQVAEITFTGLVSFRVCEEHIPKFIKLLHRMEADLEGVLIQMEAYRGVR